MYPTPLPNNPFQTDKLQAAYNQCLTLEAEAPFLEPAKHLGCPPPIVCARLLGHLLRLAPPGNGQVQLQQDITSAKDHATIMQLATFYLNNFICAFKRSDGPTPKPSEHSSESSSPCPLFKNNCELAMPMEECKPELDYRSAWAFAMHRDNNHCAISGIKDYNQPGGSVMVQAAHIIPQSINKDTGKEVQSTLSMFTHNKIIEDLSDNHIHRLENIVSMNIASHQLFNELYLWLKPVKDTPHKYYLCVARDELRHFTNPSLPECVTFTTATSLPLPHHEYLALHALCCEVAWMSGAVEYIRDIERRMDDTEVLADDGSAADLLVAALSRVKAH